MAGIRSIGWWIPAARRSTEEIAQDQGVPVEAIARLGLVSKAVAGDDDHPSTMGARATRLALRAAELEPADLDLLIFAGVTRDWPAPWTAAFGVLHELGGSRAAGMDVASRCAGGIDALWLARTLVDAGAHRTVAVCCADRYDHVMRPGERRADLLLEAAYSAGAATAIVSADAGNDIAAFSSITNPDLSVHTAGGPLAGGTRRPVDAAAVQDHLHLWRSRLSVRDGEMVGRYSTDADRHNYPRVIEGAGFDAVDFAVCSPVIADGQLEVFRELGIGPEKTMFTIPHLGHVGPADLFLILGVAIACGRDVGRRIVMSVRTPVYSNAVAIRGHGEGPAIRVAGEGVDVGLWSARRTKVPHAPHGPG